MNSKYRFMYGLPAKIKQGKERVSFLSLDPSPKIEMPKLSLSLDGVQQRAANRKRSPVSLSVDVIAREDPTIGCGQPFFAGPSKRASQLGQHIIEQKIPFKTFAQP